VTCHTTDSQCDMTEIFIDTMLCGSPAPEHRTKPSEI
jgi:hypothetical protein